MMARRILSIAIGIAATIGSSTCLRATSNPGGPVVISGKRDVVIQNQKITSSTGDCVVIANGANVTIRASEIGPCKGNAIRISGGRQIYIYDNYIHPEGPISGCCDNSDAVFASGVAGITIQGNVIAYGEANIEVQRSSAVLVRGNLLINPRNGGSRGQQFQCSDNCSGVVVEGNYMIASLDTAKYKMAAAQEDAINLIGGQTGPTTDITVKENYISGGFSRSGCGVLSDTGVRELRILNNILVDSGQCGIGVASGVDVTITGNRVRNANPIDGGGNAGLYVWSQYKTACRTVLIANNVISSVNTRGADSSYWNGGGCEGVKTTGNVVGESALSQLTPVSIALPPPLAPPIPYSCAIESPFTTQVSVTRCAANTTSTIE